jgi:hypothetical protein
MRTQIEKEEFLTGLDCEVSILDYIDDLDNINSFDELYDALRENNAFDVEIIYYANAMEYLSENDNSLRDPLAIASELGFEASSLSSETLASLHASRAAEDEFTDLQNEIDEFFNE